MISEVDQRVREQLTAASPELIAPFRALVSIAMRRVREGAIDERVGMRGIALQHDDSQRMYYISEDGVRVVRLGSLYKAFSVGNLDFGLIVSGIQLNEYSDVNSPLGALHAVQIPRRVRRVRQDTLNLQRGSNPEHVWLLTQELEESRRIDFDVYFRAFRILEK